MTRNSVFFSKELTVLLIFLCTIFTSIDRVSSRRHLPEAPSPSPDPDFDENPYHSTIDNLPSSHYPKLYPQRPHKLVTPYPNKYPQRPHKPVEAEPYPNKYPQRPHKPVEVEPYPDAYTQRTYKPAESYQRTYHQRSQKSVEPYPYQPIRPRSLASQQRSQTGWSRASSSYKPYRPLSPYQYPYYGGHPQLDYQDEPRHPYGMDSSLPGDDDFFRHGRGRRGVDIYPVDPSMQIPMDDSEPFGLEAPQTSWSSPYENENPYQMRDFQGTGDDDLAMMPDDFFEPPPTRGTRNLAARSRFNNYRSSYYDNMASSGREEPESYNLFSNPSREYESSTTRSRRHHNRYSAEQPEENIFPRQSYGPYGYGDPDFDESILQELEMLNQNQEQQPEDFFSVDGNNPRPEESNSEFNLRGMVGGNEENERKNAPPSSSGKRPEESDFDAANALEEEIVLGDVRRTNNPGGNRNSQEGVSTGAANQRENGIKLPGDDQKSESRESLRQGAQQKNLRNPQPGRGPQQQQQQQRQPQPRTKTGGRAAHRDLPSSLRGGNKPSLDEEGGETLRRRGPGHSATRISFYGDVNDEGDASSGNGMDGNFGGSNELNRRRRSALVDTFYNDRPFPIIRPVSFKVPNRYVYNYGEDQPAYPYEFPSFVYDRMRRQGPPMELIMNRKRAAGPPRRVVRRVIKRLPLLRKERRLRRMRQDYAPTPAVIETEPEAEDEESNEEEVEENTVQVEPEPITPVPSTVDESSATTVNTTDNADETITTDETTTTPNTLTTEESIEQSTEETETEEITTEAVPVETTSTTTTTTTNKPSKKDKRKGGSG